MHRIWPTFTLALLLAAVARAEAPVELRAGDLLALWDERIVRIDPGSGEVETVVSGFDLEPPSAPRLFHLAHDGTLFISLADRILRYDPANGAVSVVASDEVGAGPSVFAVAVTLGEDGHLYGARIFTRFSFFPWVEILRIDPHTGDRVVLADHRLYGSSQAMLALPDGRFLIAMDETIQSRSEGQLLLLDPDGANRFIDFDARSTVSMALDPAASAVYVVARGNSAVGNAVWRVPLEAPEEAREVYSCEIAPPGFGSPVSVAAVRPGQPLHLSLAHPKSVCQSGPLDAYVRSVIRLDPESGEIEELFRSTPRLTAGILRNLVVVPDDLEFPDADGDRVHDLFDVCPSTPDPAQEDRDGNGVGDACNDFEDSDGDDHADVEDGCPEVPDPAQHDGDGDGIGDACDPFPFEPNNEAAALEIELARVSGELALCLADDRDGVPPELDRCPATPAGAPVDLEGCSAAEFCAFLTFGRDWRSLCAAADWLGDEVSRRGDCRPVGEQCEAVPDLVY